jgi:hypothetical protein
MPTYFFTMRFKDYLSIVITFLTKDLMDGFKFGINLKRQFRHVTRTKITHYNTDGIVNCLLQPGQLRNQLHKSILSTSFHLVTFGTLTHTAAETKSIGLQVDAQLAAFFALRL